MHVWRKGDAIYGIHDHDASPIGQKPRVNIQPLPSMRGEFALSEHLRLPLDANAESSESEPFASSRSASRL